MKFLPLVWALLWRSRARTWLTFLSVVVAFLLFGLLDSVSRNFMLGVRISGDDRLIVTYRQGLTKLLPIAYRRQLEQIDGVMAVQPTMFLPGWYQDPKNQIQIIAIDPNVVVDTRILVPEDQAQAFRATRTGVLVGRELAEQYGWKIGDRVPIHSLQQKKDDTEIWELDVVGFYELDEAQTGGRHVPSLNMAMNIDYYNEGSKFSDRVVWFTVRVRDPKRATAVAAAIDRHFRNSEFETRTQSEADFQRGFVKQFGNVGRMMTAILAAVFFTLLLVAGNSMMQSFRERVPEIAVMKQRRAGLQAGMAGRRAELAALLRAAYRVGEQAPLKVLLAQDRVADAQRALAYHGYLQRDRIARIQALTAELREIDTLQQQIEARRDALAATRRRQDAQVAELERARRERAALVKTLDARYDARAAREKALGRDAKALQRLLAQLRAAAAKAEAARRAAASQPKPSTSGTPLHKAVASGPALQVGGLGWPVAGSLLASYGGPLPDGRASEGVLIGAAAGTTVKAVADGRVVFADWMNGYGLILIVDHRNGYMSLYAHNDALLRDAGDAVKRGDPVATVGNSGGQGRAALYFELRRNGKPVDPKGWLQRR